MYKSLEAKREHHRKYLKEKYHSDPVYREQHKARTAINSRKYRKQKEDLLSEFRKNGCNVCGEKDSSCLVAHHSDPNKKEFAISYGLKTNGHSLTAFARELEKCICLCQNCHHKYHAGRLSHESLLRPCG
jgi:hypothetical protein